MRKLHNKFIALTLSAAMILGMIPAQGIRAAEETTAEDEIKYERIDIRTAEEFADFASKCYIDAWSENKYVSLKADIDLAGTQIHVVPVFNGIFDGVGHTISGFDYTGDGYVAGLFRYVENQGLIQNLTLKGNIESENQKECIGSVCGVNYGTIKNCTFQGTVSGRDTVGGIAGINGDTGNITGCSAKGRITGYYSTGGIVGINHGTVNYCSNRAGINDNSEWVEEDDEMGTGMGILESLTSSDDSELYSGVDTGGIAGFSDGLIVRCTNLGTVGYEHTGYNIGGIVGRQSGIVSYSTNNGIVYGRKDIGGIVGQMEPFIEVNEAESLRAAVNRLHDLIDKTINDMQASKNGVKRDFDMLTSYSDGAVDAADALAEQIGGFVDDNLDQIQSMTDRFGHVMNLAPGVLNDFEAAENSFNNAVEALKRVSGDLGKITDVGDEPYDVSKNRRITLLHTVGGYITTDSYNPKTGDEVKITVETDGSANTYQLSEIKVFKVTNSAEVSITKSSDTKYTFTMPAENVRVEAYFEPEDGIALTGLDASQISFSLIENADVEEAKSETETDRTQEPAEETDRTIASDAGDPSTEESGTETSESSDTPESAEETGMSEELEEALTRYGAGAAFLGGAAGDNDNNSDTVNDGTDRDSSTDENADINNNNGDAFDTDKNSGSDRKENTTDKNNNGNVKDDADNDDDSSVKDEADNDNNSADKGGEHKNNSIDFKNEKNGVTMYADPLLRADAPVIKITSNLSGSASCLSKDNKAVVTAEPSGGYTVDYVTLDGSRISPDSGNSYAFPTESGKEYNVDIRFKKTATKSGAVDTAKSEIKYAIREAQDVVSKVNDNNTVSAAELQKMLSAVTTVMENTEILADIYGRQASDSLKAVSRDLENASDHLRSALDSVKSATGRTRDIVNYVNGQPDINFTKLGAEYDFNRINLNNHLQAISDSLKLLGEDASNYSDVVNADLRAVNDQVNVIFNLLADRLSDAQKMELEAFYNDVSDEDIDSITTGRVESCCNKGVIKGDNNVGGIAGSMSIDDEDLDDSAIGSIEFELGRRFILKCLVTDSVNEGYVTAKKNGAGGICGYMDHGIIMDSESYGSVESTEGDYAGGICGESLTIIKGCYSLCFVAGNKNVGGIAGYADTLKNCYSMADVQSENGRAGAIAGQISEYDKVSAGAGSESEEAAGPKVVGNYYVGESIHGIDNISYTGVAEPITYDELLTVEQLPAQFSHLKVIYRIDDTYLGSEEVKYGTKLDHLNYPQIPEKEGCYGVWPDVSDQRMGGIFVVEGEYKDNVTVVQSSGEADAAEEGQWKKPYALIEDIFTEDTILNVEIGSRTPPEEAAEKQHVIYEVTLENSGIEETDSFALRLLNPYEDAAVYGYRNGAWEELEGKVRGQYLQVSMTGTQEYFCIAENTFNPALIIICAAAAAVVVILLVVAVRKGSARRKQKLQKKKETTEE